MLCDGFPPNPNLDCKSVADESLCSIVENVSSAATNYHSLLNLVGSRWALCKL